MKYIFYVSILVFAFFLPVLAQNNFQAVVNEDDATFTFPLNPKQEYEWSSGGLTYQWSVIVTNNRKRYEFGFYLYTAMGASPTESGDINALLKAGQLSVWSGTKVLDSVKVDGFASEAKDKLTIKITGKKSVQLLFSSKSKYVTFSTLLELFEKPTNVQVPVQYNLNKAPNSQLTQANFTVYRECDGGVCHFETTSFDYGKNLRISVGRGDSSLFYYFSVEIAKGEISKAYIYSDEPVPHFVEKERNQKVNEKLNKLLLDVYNLGIYIMENDLNISNKKFSETGRYTVLTNLRNYTPNSTGTR